MAANKSKNLMTGFGKKLKQARQHLGLTGAELAAKLGVERTSIPQYENGHSFPSIPVLMKLSRALGVTVDWLLFEEYETAGQIQDKELAAQFVIADKFQHGHRS